MGKMGVMEKNRIKITGVGTSTERLSKRVDFKCDVGFVIVFRFD